MRDGLMAAHCTRVVGAGVVDLRAFAGHQRDVLMRHLGLNDPRSKSL